MACIESSGRACCKPCAGARRGRGVLFVLELLVILVVVVSQVLQLFVSPSAVLLAAGTIPCALLRKRPLIALLLACTSVATHLISGGSFFRALAKETAKGLSKCSELKATRGGAGPRAKHLYAPQGTIVDLVGERQDDASAEPCAERELGERDVDTASNSETRETTCSACGAEVSASTAEGCASKSGDVFSRRSSNNTQRLYRVGGDARHNMDIDREMQAAENVMDEMYAVFSDA